MADQLPVSREDYPPLSEEATGLLLDALCVVLSREPFISQKWWSEVDLMVLARLTKHG